ncbi:fructokinase-1 [Cicer arietinum]|uniref:Fructokinase-1 n=1 Tax=Cicer arietinum TaxID=3827 RepID=A0A1S2XWQ6_CICAR|nr:fructokinase-1 [Cicer arietinum]
MPLLQISPTTTTTTKSLNSPPIPFYHPHYASYFHSNSNPKFKFRPIFSLNLACKGLGVAVSSSPPPDSKLRNKNVDVATLGNLCVDIVLNVPQLPPPSLSQRKAFMERLASSPPSKKFWEAGGTCNMSIAAARLGLDCVSIGHVGNEIYGKFLLDVLHDEGIDMVKMSTNDDTVSNSGASYETLLCWVLVDPLQRHGFCSRADFFKEPAFNWLSKMSREAKLAIKNSKVLFCNGYGFDELSPGLLLTVVDCAVEVGTSIFFDPGPRGKNLITGTPEEQRALNHFLRMSDVLLLTADEAESLTGIGDPILAGQELLKRGIRTKWVIVKMGLVGSVLMTASSITCAPAFKVNIADTVGCGDSFVAAIAYGFIHNLPMVNTLAIANAVGAATAMGCGAGRNVASIEKVVDILRSSNLNEDDEFWTQILDKKMVDQEVTCLSKIVRNVNRNHLNFVPFDKVASELLPKLEFPQTVENVRT